MLQKRHFEAIAQVLARSKPALRNKEACAQWELTVIGFAEMLTNDNPRFSRTWFEKACKSGDMDRPADVARRERDRPEAPAIKEAWDKKMAENAKRNPPVAPMTVDEIRATLKSLRGTL